MRTIRVISTKKLLSNQKQFLLNANFSVIEADFITVKSLQGNLQSQINEVILFTSQNAVKAVFELVKIEEIKDKKVFCVGEKTKLMLEKKGVKVALSAHSAAELAEIIISQNQTQNYTFFCGNLRHDVLPKKLKKAKVSYNEIEVYQTLLTPHRITAKPDGILFYSPSGVLSYLKENKITDETCFCIGNTTAKALETITKNIVIANQPSVENVIIQCINYYRPKR